MLLIILHVQALLMTHSDLQVQVWGPVALREPEGSQPAPSLTASASQAASASLKLSLSLSLWLSWVRGSACTQLICLLLSSLQHTHLTGTSSCGLWHSGIMISSCSGHTDIVTDSRMSSQWRTSVSTVLNYIWHWFQVGEFLVLSWSFPADILQVQCVYPKKSLMENKQDIQTEL